MKTLFLLLTLQGIFSCMSPQAVIPAQDTGNDTQADADVIADAGISDLEIPDSDIFTDTGEGDADIPLYEGPPGTILLVLVLERTYCNNTNQYTSGEIAYRCSSAGEIEETSTGDETVTLWLTPLLIFFPDQFRLYATAADLFPDVPLNEVLLNFRDVLHLQSLFLNPAEEYDQATIRLENKDDSLLLAYYPEATELEYGVAIPPQAYSYNATGLSEMVDLLKIVAWGENLTLETPLFNQTWPLPQDLVEKSPVVLESDSPNLTLEDFTFGWYPEFTPEMQSYVLATLSQQSTAGSCTQVSDCQAQFGGNSYCTENQKCNLPCDADGDCPSETYCERFVCQRSISILTEDQNQEIDFSEVTQLEETAATYRLVRFSLFSKILNPSLYLNVVIYNLKHRQLRLSL